MKNYIQREKKMNWNPEKYLIFETLTGSRLYGTFTEHSDYDYRGICIPPAWVTSSLFQNFEQKDSGFEEPDRVIYSMSKFFKLCADANPNIIELLFTPENCWRYISTAGRWIIQNRDVFLSKKIRYTFSGYAYSQLNDIKRHRQWFINPPKEKPSRESYGLTSAPLISGDGLETLANRLDLLKPEAAEEVRRELSYRDAKRQWDNYLSWKNNRNPHRMALEEKYGYDTKHAMHFFRLLEEGRQLLLNGNIIFPLENREALVEILNGKYEYEELISHAEQLDILFNSWYERSALIHSPCRDDIDRVYQEIISYNQIEE